MENEIEINGKKYVLKSSIPSTPIRKRKEGVWQVGENYFIRTVTMALCGKLIEVTDKELVLEKASWVVDTGRFSDFLKSGTLSSTSEVEPFPEGDVIVGRGGIIDATIWKHELLTKQK